MKYKHSCVVDVDGYYQTLVIVLLETDKGGKIQEKIQHYMLQGGESLVDTAPPIMRPHTGANGLIMPRWDEREKEWVEGATVEEIADWEAEHPAPEPPALTEMERLRESNRILTAQVAALSEQNDFQEDLIVELAGIVYA